MKQVKLILTLGVAALILFTSCLAQDIKELEISRLEVNLVESGSQHTEAVTPGLRSKLKLDVYDSNGELVKRPDHRGFIPVSKNGSFTIVRQDRNGIVLKADGDQFRMIEIGEYELELTIADNPFRPQFYSWPINWTGLNTIDYSGKDGEDGKNGRKGMDGVSTSTMNIDGHDGEDGKDGKDGKNARNVTLIAAYYDIGNTALVEGSGESKLLLFYDPDWNRYYLSNLQEVKVDLSGGNGGKGGKGGAPGKGAEYRESTVSAGPNIKTGPDTSFAGGSGKKGKDGKPGKGGDGGKGGRGGYLKIICYDPAVMDYIKTDVSGGKPGEPGEGGHDKFSHPSFKDKGEKTYLDGLNGYVEVNELSFEVVKAMLEEIDNEHFKIERVVE